MTQPIRILVVGDCPELELSELHMHVTRLDGAQLRTSFSQEIKGFEIALLDGEQDDELMLSFLRFFRKVSPQCPTLMLAHPEKIGLVQAAIQEGLDDYLLRCTSLADRVPLLTHSIEKALRSNYLRERLHGSEQRFWTFFEHSPLGKAIIGLDGLMEHSNPLFCEWMGVSMDELREKRFPELLPHRERKIWEPIQKEFAKNRRDYLNLMQEVHAPGGEELWLQSSFVLMRDPSGEPSYLVASFADMTEKKELQKRIQYADKMQAMGRLTGGITHDFNNLLTIVESHCYIMQEVGDDAERVAWSVHRILSATERGSRLTRQLLSFGRPHSDTSEAVDANEVLQDLRVVLESFFGKIVRVDMALAPELEDIHCDRSQLEQVVVNLAINARDAMDDGGQFTIRTYNLEVRQPLSTVPAHLPWGEYVVIEVEDTGTGMSPEVQARIFEPFFTTKELGQGTGLGLATVQSVVTQNEGYIMVDSEEGRGTRFQIFLPCSSQRSSTLPRLRRVRQGMSGFASETILLVEDETELREPVKRLLEAKGYHVLDAGSGEEALAISKQYRGQIDLLLSDVIMPGFDGFRLAKEVRAARPDIGVLMMSGYTAEVLSRNPEALEEHRLLQKPFGMEILSRTIRQMLEN